MDTKDELTVLLAEYNTMRTEVIAARTYVGQTLAIGAVAVSGLGAGLLSRDAPFKGVLLGALLGVIIVVGLVCWLNHRGTSSFTRRIRTLEAEINRIVGKRLLVWETDHGWGGFLVDQSAFQGAARGATRRVPERPLGFTPAF
jgi:hypothetical protein